MISRIYLIAIISILMISNTTYAQVTNDQTLPDGPSGVNTGSPTSGPAKLFHIHDHFQEPTGEPCLIPLVGLIPRGLPRF